MDDIIRNSPFSEPVGGFLFGFSSTLLTFISMIVLLIILYDYYRFENNSFLIRIYDIFIDRNEFVLPLWRKPTEIPNDEMTMKPDLSFVIPAINVDQIGYPMSPLSTGLKKRSVSTNSFSIPVTPQPTPLRGTVELISNNKQDV